MSNTKREPLLSDKVIRDTFMYGSLIECAEHGFMSGANLARDHYEAARAKDAELIAFILKKWRDELDGDGWEASANYEEALAAAGFKPSEQ